MRSATSFFNLTLLKKNVQRFWFIWAVYFVVLLFSLPISLLLRAVNLRGMPDGHRILLEYAATAPGNTAVLLMQLTVILGVVAAMALFSYLYSGRSTGAIHTLPIRREGLFFTNVASGLLFFWVPNVVIFLLMVVCEGALGCLRMAPLWGWLAVACGYSLIFFGIAVFCAMLTGHLAVLPVFYTLANCLAMGVVWLIQHVLEQFVFGFVDINPVERAADWLTPVAQLGRHLGTDWNWDETSGKLLSVKWTGLWMVGVYALAAVVLLALSLLLYRRRAMERAGDVVAVGWVRPIFRYGVAACFALSFGQLLYNMFYGAVPRGAWSMLVFLLICGAVGYFLASMLLAKSFRVLRRWKGCVAFLAAVVVLTVAMEMDLSGYERWTPDREDVAGVWVQNIATYPYDDSSYAVYWVTDPDVIDQVIALHGNIVSHKSEIEDDSRDSESATGFEVIYQLNSGMKIARNYDYLPVSRADLETPGTYAYELEQFVNSRESICTAYNIQDLASYPMARVWMDILVDAERGEYQTVEITDSQQLESIRTALLTDFSQGNLGRRSILSSAAETELVTLYYEYRQPERPGQSDPSSAVPEVWEADGASVSITDSGRYVSRSVAIPAGAVNTLAALEEAGVPVDALS